MRITLFAIWAFALTLSILGCSETYPPCPIPEADREYQPPEGGEDEGPGEEAPGGPTWPSGDGLADDEGYKRLGQGEICRCKLGSDLACSRGDPSVETSDATCDVREPNDPDCGPGWSYATPDGTAADNQTDATCKLTFFCCYTIECVGRETASLSNFPFCPSWFGEPNATRYIAFDKWHRLVVLGKRADMRRIHKTKACYIWESNCREQKALGPICGSYPGE